MDSQLAVVLVTNFVWMSIAVVVYLNGRKNDAKNTKTEPVRSQTPEPVTPIEVKASPVVSRKGKKNKKNEENTATGTRKRSVSFTKEQVCYDGLDFICFQQQYYFLYSN